MDLNKLGATTYKCAVKRGKAHPYNSLEKIHQETLMSLVEEVLEVSHASETKPSEHLPTYTEIAEELADVLIVTLTELHRRNIDIEALLQEKIHYNENRYK